MEKIHANLILEDGKSFEGVSFGADIPVAGEVVFNTGMVGYPESLTDPSYYGQILVFTYPLIGNYGVPENNFAIEDGFFESDRIHVKGLIVSEESVKYSHWRATQSLSNWLKNAGIPAISGIDTRHLTQILREEGTMLGKIIFNNDIEFFNPNRVNLVKAISPTEVTTLGKGKKRVALLDCGSKLSIIRSLLRRNVEVLRLPWDADIAKYDFDGILISNGPGDPKQCTTTINNIKYAIDNDIRSFGICLGNQLLALAAGADTYKLKYGHRGQNQPVRELGSDKCIITSQNHGYAVKDDAMPEGWLPWFRNLNDNTNEGLVHESGRFMSVQFHPEATPGAQDAVFIIDKFIEML